MITLRLSPSGQFLENIALNFTGTYEGTQLVVPPPVVSQKITIGFRPIVVQVIVQVTAGPDTGIQIAKTKEMPGFTAFVQTAASAGLDSDTLQIEDDGFTVRNAANGGPLLVVGPYFFFAQG